jgi:hypothetical protein
MLNDGFLSGFFGMMKQGLMNIIQTIGVSILAYFTDPSDSLAKLIKHVPDGTVVKGLECYETEADKFLGNKKSTVVGHSSALSLRDEEGSSPYLSKVKTKIQTAVNDYVIKTENTFSIKDYIKYILIAIIFLAFTGSIYYYSDNIRKYLPDVGDSVDGNSGDGADASTGGGPIVHPSPLRPRIIPDPTIGSAKKKKTYAERMSNLFFARDDEEAQRIEDSAKLARDGF